MLLGIDIYNGNSDAYNMDVVKAQGVSFVWHKMSQGGGNLSGTWMDWKVQGALNRARAAGIPLVGGYHWLLRGQGAAQAELFFASMQKCGGPRGMLAAVDVERNDWNTALNPDVGTLRDFLNRWDQLSGGQPMFVYSAPWYWGPYMGSPTDIGARADTRVWTSQYYEPHGAENIGTAINNVTPGVWSGWGGFPADALSSGRGVRQWTSRGVVAGLQSDCDCFVGSLDQLRAATAPNGVPPPPPPPPPAPLGVDVRKIQGAVHATQDGIWGPDTDRRCELVRHRGPNIAALQLVLQVPADGIWGPVTQGTYITAVKLIQEGLRIAVVDGAWGPVTDAAYVAASPLR